MVGINPQMKFDNLYYKNNYTLAITGSPKNPDCENTNPEFSNDD